MSSSNPKEKYEQHSATGIPVTASQSYQRGRPGTWSSGLCDCFSDCFGCCLTCCPCITFGPISEIVDTGSSSCVVNGAIYFCIAYLTGCACLYSCLYRSKMRQQFNLEESPCHDCLVHFCCKGCALCQEYRELKTRGFDVSVGTRAMKSKENSVALSEES